MAAFEQTFRQHVQDELRYRRDFNNAQTVYMPHVRVTSLITGDIAVPPSTRTIPLYGFTLGMPDLAQLNTIDSVFNVPDKGPGTVVGMTYMHGSGTPGAEVDYYLPRPVVINTGIKNCPPPGVTDVIIDTSASRGLTFKAVVKFKFYGKKQYDFLFQTFMRPGNQIVIEYGHTRKVLGDEFGHRPAPDGSNTIEHGISDTGTTNKDLGFFQKLHGEAIDRFRDHLMYHRALPTSRNAGTVLGFVSNFKVRLNDKNEYEAEIELINALEFLFTLNPQDTFLDYSKVTAAGSNDYLSKSIVSNFGNGTTDDDAYYKFIMNDYMDARRSRVLPMDQTYGSSPNSPDPGFELEMQPGEIGKAILVPDQHNSGPVYVSLYYFFRRLLQEIINRGYTDKNGLLRTVGYRQIILHEFEMPFRRDLRTTDMSKVIINNSKLYDSLSGYSPSTLPGLIIDGSRVNFSTTAASEEFTASQLVAESRLHSRNDSDRYAHMGELNYWGNPHAPQLSSTYFEEIRGEEYSKKYVRLDVLKMFKIHAGWQHKELYSVDNTLKGIFINYNIIKDAFINSRSVAEAIQKVLNAVNTSTNGILNLKMRNVVAEVVEEDLVWHIPRKSAKMTGAQRMTRFEDRSTAIAHGHNLYDVQDDTREAIRISIYDESHAVSKDDRDDLYTFFEETATAPAGSAEAMSFDLDFSLPSSIAAGVMASTFTPQAHWSAGGSSKNKAFIDYGYKLRDDGSGELAIKDIIAFREQNMAPQEETDETGKIEVKGGVLSLVWSKITWTLGWAFQFLKLNSPSDVRDANQIKVDEEAGLERATTPENFFAEKLGYQEFMPAAMKADAARDGYLTVFPATAKISINIQGLDGFRFGDLFSVENVLPDPYNTNNIFMLHGWKHNISSQGWVTEISGQFISIRPDEEILKIRDREDGTPGQVLLPLGESGPKGSSGEGIDLPAPDITVSTADDLPPNERNNPFNLKWDGVSEWKGAVVKGVSMTTGKKIPERSNDFIVFQSAMWGFRAGFCNHLTHNNTNLRSTGTENSVWSILRKATPYDDNVEFWDGKGDEAIAAIVQVGVRDQIDLNHRPTGEKFAFAVAAMESGKPASTMRGFGKEALDRIAADSTKHPFGQV